MSKCQQGFKSYSPKCLYPNAKVNLRDVKVYALKDPFNFACNFPIVVLMNVDILRHLQMAFPTQYYSYATNDSPIATFSCQRIFVTLKQKETTFLSISV